MNSLFKASTALALVATLSACGGGSTSEVSEQLQEDYGISEDAADQIADIVDTDDDEVITEEEISDAMADEEVVEEVIALAAQEGNSMVVNNVINTFSATGTTIKNTASGQPIETLTKDALAHIMSEAIGTAFQDQFNMSMTDECSNADVVSQDDNGQVCFNYDPNGEYLDYDAFQASIDLGKSELLSTFDFILNHSDDDFSELALSFVNTWSVYSEFGSDKFYDYVNVEGLKEAHNDGYSGYGVEVYVEDNGVHLFDVANTLSAVAPSASLTAINNYGDGDSLWIGGYDTEFVSESDKRDTKVVNHSYSRKNITDDIRALALQVSADEISDEFDFYGANTLHVRAGSNTDTCETTITECDVEWEVYASEGAETVGLIGIYAIAETNGTPVGDNTWLQENSLVAYGGSLIGGYGNSFAAPRVSGAAALIIEKFDTTADATRDILLNTADDSFEGYSAHDHGQGMLDLNAAMSPVSAATALQ